MKIIDCKKIAEEMKAYCKRMIDTYANDYILEPRLIIIQVGDNQASNAYIKSKIKACEEVGITVVHAQFPEDTERDRLVREIEYWNNDDSASGIILQLPLPKHFDEKALIEHIWEYKDVDRMTELVRREEAITNSEDVPCTPAGILHLLKHENIPTQGKHVVILGRSDLVGKPLAQTLASKRYNATVTLCNSYTENLDSIIASADIVISAVGKKGTIKNGMLAPHAVLIDVGINRDENGKLIGDADRDVECFAKTTVPGGVGVLTVASLLMSTVRLWMEDNHLFG